MLNCLVIGMGFGKLYEKILKEDGHTVVTVDPYAKADFDDLEKALESNHFDTVNICTPNFTHLDIATTVAKYEPDVVFIEKPGLKTSIEWAKLVTSFPDTKWSMVKNNQFRDIVIDDKNLLKNLFTNAVRVEFNWCNTDRVPNPGSWFTTKSKAWGGVSRDLMPHLLSWFTVLTKTHFGTADFSYLRTKQNWQLADVQNTNYGIVNQNGIYDVDDDAALHYTWANKSIKLTANWRTLKAPELNIVFTFKSGEVIKYEFGLCPESAYLNMVKHTYCLKGVERYWSNNLLEDLWIIDQVDLLGDTK
jgi:predicted dehydrogenase